MTTHSLQSGRDVIAELKAIGEALGYSVRTELPTADKHNSPAVDVAWMRESNQRFPLMILEVESAASNSAAYNPVKVFGPRNTDFEKPLFFFHVFLTGGEDSSRIKDLQSLFGTYNYRAYRLGLSDATSLIKDILSQHRRVSSLVNLRALGEAISNSTVFRDCTAEAIHHAQSLQYDDDFVLALAELCQHDRTFEPLLKDQLIRIHTAPHPDTVYPKYQTYFGATWSIPVHIGLLQYWTHDATGKWLKALEKWQEKGWYLTQIGPHFGLSRDYDEFIFTLAAPFLGLLAGLMRSEPRSGGYIADQCAAIFDCIEKHPSASSRFWSLWILQISSSFNLVDQFSRCRAHLNQYFGGVVDDSLYCPPGFISPGEDDDNEENTALKAVPELQVYQNELRSRIAASRQPATDGVDVALKTLLDGEYPQEWAWPIVRLLNSENIRTQGQQCNRA